jgi:hypothetical protein
MTVRVKKIHPALKHGAYSATALLPGEDPAAFERLHQDLIAELRPDGSLESETVATIARVTWRKQNLDTFRIAQYARDRYSAIRSAKVPSTTPPIEYPYLHLFDSPDWTPPDPADVEAGEKAADAQARNELGDKYLFVAMGDAATVPEMLKEFEVEERLDTMIDRHLKRLLGAVRNVVGICAARSPAT